MDGSLVNSCGVGKFVNFQTHHLRFAFLNCKFENWSQSHELQISFCLSIVRQEYANSSSACKAENSAIHIL